MLCSASPLLLLLLLALLALQAHADVFLTNARITATSITFVGGGTQSLAATNTTLTATTGSVDMSNFLTATSNTSRYVAAGSQVYFHDIGTETHAQDYFEGLSVAMLTSASGSSFTSSNSVYNCTGNSEWGIVGQDTISSTNDVFTGSASQDNLLELQANVAGTATNAVVSSVNYFFSQNFQYTSGSITAKDNGVIDIRNVRATSTALTANYLGVYIGQLASLTFTKTNPYTYYSYPDDVVFFNGPSTITDCRFVGLTGRFRTANVGGGGYLPVRSVQHEEEQHEEEEQVLFAKFERQPLPEGARRVERQVQGAQASLDHAGGRSEWQWIGSNFGSWNLQTLVITGPAFRLGNSAGQFQLSASTYDFRCYDIYSQCCYNYDESVMIRTNSPQHCVDVLPAPGGNRPVFHCDENVNQNALLFYPRTNDWYADYWNSNCCGPRVCASTSVMAPINGPTVVNGVSFTSTMRFQLTHTFTYADLFLPRVDKSDFFFWNGAARVVSVRQLTAETGAVNGVWTHVYEVTVEAQCDGLISLRYQGTVSRNTNDNRAGMQPQTNHLVYAGCLGQQFCL